MIVGQATSNFPPPSCTFPVLLDVLPFHGHGTSIIYLFLIHRLLERSFFLVKIRRFLRLIFPTANLSIHPSIYWVFFPIIRSSYPQHLYPCHVPSLFVSVDPYP